MFLVSHPPGCTRAVSRRRSPAVTCACIQTAQPHEHHRPSKPGTGIRRAPSKQPREVLRELGSIGDDTYARANAVHSGALDALEPGRLWAALSLLNGWCQLSGRELQLVLIRYPAVFSSSPSQLQEVLDFLSSEPLGLTAPQLRSVITRFPQVFSLGVKAHLRPQLAVLQSLGVPQARLREYVIARPLLLGEGIDTVIHFLKVCGVPRQQLAAVLRTYPIDYCCRFRFRDQGHSSGRYIQLPPRQPPDAGGTART